MALHNTTFRLSDETRHELDDLAERMGLQSGDLKRRVVRRGIEAIKADLSGEGVTRELPPALANLIDQQRKLSDAVERQISQAEKAFEKQKAQADSILAHLSAQQSRLTESVEEKISHAEKAIERQKAQVEGFLAGLMAQQRRLGEQILDHLPAFVRRGRGEEGESEGGEGEEEAKPEGKAD